jgi:hypothetical protein
LIDGLKSSTFFCPDTVEVLTADKITVGMYFNYEGKIIMNARLMLSTKTTTIPNSQAANLSDWFFTIAGPTPGSKESAMPSATFGPLAPGAYTATGKRIDTSFNQVGDLAQATFVVPDAGTDVDTADVLTVTLS